MWSARSGDHCADRFLHRSTLSDAADYGIQDGEIVDVLAWHACCFGSPCSDSKSTIERGDQAMNRTTWCMTIGLGACLTGVGMLAGTPTESGRAGAPAGHDQAPSTIPDWCDRLRRADTALSE